jgi:hypothetical protein
MAKENEYSLNLAPVMRNALDIPQRLKELDNRLFVMFDIITQRYEIHRSDLEPNTRMMVLEYDQLDGRAINKIKYGMKKTATDTVKEVLKYNENLRKYKDKKSKEVIRDMSVDIANDIKRGYAK